MKQRQKTEFGQFLVDQIKRADMSQEEFYNARNTKDGIAQLQSYMSVCPNCEWGM